MNVYFVVEGEETLGPYTVGELREMAAEGRLTTEHILLTSDQQARIKAGLVVGIFGAELPPEIPAAPTTPDEADTASRRRFLWWAVGVLVVLPVVAFAVLGMSLLAVQKREAKDKADSEANLKNIVRAVMAYAADHDDRLPSLNPPLLTGAIKPYVQGPVANKHPLGPDWATEEAYSFRRLGEIEKADRTPVLFDPTARRDGTHIVAFASGRVQAVDAADFMTLQADAAKRRAASGAGGPTAGFPQTIPAP